MQSAPIHLRRKGLLVAVSAALAALGALPCTGAAPGSGVYQTLPGALVREWGDRVPNGSRMVPWFGTCNLELSGSPASFTGLVTNAVLEGGNPFPLTVRSSSASQLADGTYRFTGDYLGELYPLGSQYGFDWRFSASTNGEVVWNGTTAWMGGHLWYIDITNVVLVPVPWLNMRSAGAAAVQLTWSTNFAGHVLEYAEALPALSWNAVTNSSAIVGDRLAVTVEAGTGTRFFRLRRP